MVAAEPENSRILNSGIPQVRRPDGEDVPLEMTEEERAIVASAPRPPRTNGSRSGGAPALLPDAVAFVRAAVACRDTPVVLFGFEWCGFCWSVRKLFNRSGIACRAIDVDGAAFREDDRGGRILRALLAETGCGAGPA